MTKTHTKSSAGVAQPVAWRVMNDFGRWYITQDKALADTYRDTEKKDVQPLCLAAQQPASQPQEAWQPIETAKRKDGTRIQAWDGKKQFICHFRGEHHEPHQDKPGWFEQHIRMHPTHWKPLGPSPLSRPQSNTGEAS